MKKLLIAILLLTSCNGKDYDPKACNNHGGVAICYRQFTDTHGYIMCNDGTKLTKECY